MVPGASLCLCDAGLAIPLQPRQLEKWLWLRTPVGSSDLSLLGTLSFPTQPEGRLSLLMQRGGPSPLCRLSATKEQTLLFRCVGR